MNYTKGKRFLDTNVLFYSCDTSDAIEVRRRYQIRYWVSLIIAIAARHGCAEILSEDLNDGQIFMGVVVSNPFRVEF